MVILTHPTGNANLRAIAHSLNAAERLAAFHTSIAVFPGNIWDRIGRLPALAEFGRRRYTTRLQEKTHQHPWRELGRLIAQRGGISSLTSHESGAFSVDKVYHDLDRRVAASLKDASAARAVYAYEDGALATFTEAKKRGIKCIYDLPIAYWETGHRLMQEEAERRPAWAPTLGGGVKDSAPKRARKEQELALADVVVGPGSFVLDSLPDWAADKHRIMSPFGSPPPRLIGRSPRPADQKLRILFVGSMGQRKGLGDLFAAMRQLDPDRVELVVLGSTLAPMDFYRGVYPHFTYEPTRPHAAVLELMASCDVFCLPSIVEGRALVMQEAMSQGLPVIITPNTGGADLVIPDETGFLIPIRDPEAIATSIQWFIDHREELPRMGDAARAHAAQYTWEAYGETVVRGIEQYLVPHNN